MKILIKHATVVNPTETFNTDILISNSKIIKVREGIKERVDREINAKGKFVMPGFIDMHTHLRTPGREDEEDLLSGSYAAVKGGFTTVFCMPNTTPCIDNEGLVRWVIEEGEKIGLVEIFPVGAITKERKGKELTEFGALAKAGCCALSDDGNSVENSMLFRKALEYAKMFDLLIISHCEEKSLSKGGVMRESFVASKYGISAIADISESLRVYRDIEIAKYVKAPLHLAHISCAKSVEVIRRAKRQYPYFTSETAPHYFILTVDDIEKSGFSGNFRVNPPLGEKKDVEAIKEALKEDIIECIATDHAPHSFAEKEVPFEEASPGFIGLELAFSLVYTYLVKEKILTLQDVVKKLSTNPARILKLSLRGEIKEGFLSDIVIVDLEKEWQVTEDKLLSKSKNTPFLGYLLKGLVEYTIRRGKIVYKNE